MKEKRKLIYMIMATFTTSILFFSNNALASEEVPLEEFSLEDIVITAERIPTKKMDTPVAIEVVTSEEIESNHYNNLAEVVNHVNGVSVTNTTSFSNIMINGDDRVLILVDGRRLNSFSSMTTGKNTANIMAIPSMSNVERVEVVRGGGSALYGSDAVGGVINIITKKAKHNRTTIDLSTGSWGTQKYQITNEGSDGSLSWIATAGLDKQTSTSFKIHGANKKIDEADKDNNNFSIKLNKKFTKSSSLDIAFDHTTLKGGTYFHKVNNIPEPDYYSSQVFNNIATTYNFKEGTETPGFLRVYNNHTSAQHYSKLTTNTFGIDYQNALKLTNNNSLIFGIEYLHSKTDNENQGYTGKIIRNTAIYLQDTWKIASKWALLPGLRLDNHNKFGTHWSPKIALNYNANNKSQVFASWGKVFKAPTADDLYTNDPYTPGNPNLKPESGYTSTIGVQHKFDESTNMGITFFKSKLNDAIGWGQVGTVWTPSNIDKEDKRGMDISFTKKFNDIWSFNATYSYTRIKTQGDIDAAKIRNRNPNTYRLGIHFNHGPWKSNLYAKFISGLSEKYYLSRHATIVDFNLSYDIDKQSTIYFKVDNLLNKEYSEYPGTEPYYSSGYWNGGHYPAKGRFFQIGIKYSF